MEINVRGLILAALCMAIAPTAAAQLADCPAIAAATQTYKVVVDELQFASRANGDRAKLHGLRELLVFNLTTQLAELEAEVMATQAGRAVPLGLIGCAGRHPSVDGTEFNAARVEVLNDQRVVLELWGTLLDNTATDGSATPHAIIGYVVPPLLHYEPHMALAGKHLIRYPKVGATDPAVALRKLPEASAFALLGLALKAQRARKYDLATWAFMRSDGQLRDAQVATGVPTVAQIRAFLQHAACKTRQSARADVHYHGALRLLPAEQCEQTP